MLPLGTPAPSFSLIDTVSGKPVAYDPATPNQPAATVIAFICNHCPYVLHIVDALVEVLTTAQSHGAQVFCISSNDPEAYPQDGPDHMKQFAATHGFLFPYLFDASQDVAKAYHAACTPDFFVFDGNGACVYRGRFDAATPGNTEPVTGSELQAALTAVLGGAPVSPDQRPSIGCNIKWRKQ